MRATSAVGTFLSRTTCPLSLVSYLMISPSSLMEYSFIGMIRPSRITIMSRSSSGVAAVGQLPGARWSAVARHERKRRDSVLVGSRFAVRSRISVNSLPPLYVSSPLMRSPFVRI
jgi:hypothetical protein